jgi:hypothetical protein
MNKIGVLAAAVLLGYSCSAFAGVTFRQVTTVDGKRTAVTKVWVDGGNAKIEMVESPDNPFMPPGSYMLFAEGEMLLVNPAARTFARFDAAMLEGAAGMMGQMQFTDLQFEKVIDEAGESIEGYPTRHYQFKSSWAMSMQGMPMKTESSTVEDIWTTTAFAVPSMPANPSGGGMPPQVAALAENQGLRNIEGMPLKHVTVQSTKTSMGALGGVGGLGARFGARALGGLAGGGAGPGGGDSKTTIEAVDIEEVDVPAATFVLPDGFQETSLMQSGPAIPNLNDLPAAQGLPSSNRPGQPAVPNLNDLN